MNEQLAILFSSSNIAGTIANRIDVLSGFLDSYLSGFENLRTVSFLLMILALLLFLFIIIIIYVRAILAFLHNDRKPAASETDEDDIFDEDDALRLSQIIEKQERERELEKELQKELDLARAGRKAMELEAQEKQETELKKERQREKEKAQKKERETELEKERRNKAEVIDLDWKKGNISELEAKASQIKINVDNLSYRQSNKPLNELTGLIIDMIGRGVDDLKIAQTILFRNQYHSSEEDVLQLIDAIKDFVALCRAGNFANVRTGRDLPPEEEALSYLAEGDASFSLALLENLMDANIDRATAPGMENKKDAIYREVSAQAVIFGNLASIADVHLATGAFELAIELQPQNVAAWSRVADMYSKAESTSKAIWAYQNVLKIADGEINAREVANAGKNLSQHLYAQGNSLQAAKLYNSSKQYYDSLGINRRLDKQEVEIIEIIEANHQDELRATVLKLLGRDAARGFSFG